MQVAILNGFFVMLTKTKLVKIMVFDDANGAKVHFYYVRAMEGKICNFGDLILLYKGQN